MNRTRLAVVIATIFAPIMVAHAQEKTTLLDTMTVVGTRTETTVRDNPASVSVVEREQIEKRGADSVAELLRDVPGVSVVDTAVAGMKRIRIRGEQSNRVVILVDGQEMTDHSSFGAPFLIDPSNIERIEVVRGPASVMHGAKAIGGVINVITKKGAADPVVVELGTGYFSGSKGKQVSAAVTGTLDRFDYRLSASADDHKDRRVAKGRHSPDSTKLPNSGSENKDVSLHLGLKLGERENHYLSFKANEHRLKADGWEDNFSLVKGLPAAGIVDSVSAGHIDVTQFNANLPKRDLKKAGLYYEGTDLSPLVRKVSGDIFYQKVDREFDNSIRLEGADVVYATFPPSEVALGMASSSQDTTKTYGGSGQVDLALHEDHYTLFGVQYLKDELKTDKSNRVHLLKVVPPAWFPVAPPAHLFPLQVGDSVNSDTATMETTSAFMQDEWTLPNDFKLIAGVRYYHVKSKLDKTEGSRHNAGENSTHSRFVKSLGITWTGLPHTTLRGGYSEGYVMPSLLEQFTDSRAGRGITLNGNPDLNPERSQNYELGLRYQNRGVVFDGTLFYTKSKQYITFESCGTSGRCPGREDIYINADKAKSYGLELLVEYWLKDTPYTPYLTTTLMRRKVTVDDFSTYKTDVPAISGQLGMRYERSFAGTDLWADGFVQASSKTDKKERDILKSGKESRHLSGWSTLNFAVGGNFGDEGQHRLALHLNNLNNRHYRASVDEMPATGRNFVVTFNTSL
ncbi:MAG: TonB-dependent receptor [Gammaproteobacteria bacterium]|nr:TonB-dependent receptor [Gammaproteobacteria bacterium]